MSAQLPADSDLIASVDAAALLVITAETGAAYCELARRLNPKGRALCVPLDGNARAAMFGAISGGVSRLVAVPLSCDVGAPEQADVAGLLRWAKSR